VNAPAANKLLEGLSPDELRAAENVGETKIFEKGETIFREGDAGDTMYVVLNGKVKICKTARPGAEQVFDTLGAGDFFGEMGLVEARPRNADAVAEEKTELRILRQADLDRLLGVSPQIGLNLMKGVSDRLRRMNARFIEQVVYQEKMSLVGQMAGTIIHDFKSPMSVVRLVAETMAMKNPDAQLQKNCEMIIRNVDRITAMANDLLDFARGQVRLNRQLVEAETWLADVSELLLPVLENRDIELKREVKTREKLPIDPDKMTRVIYNLAVNSADAMSEGGTLTLRVGKSDGEFLIEIADTGNGIPEAIRDRLFDAFVTHGKKGGTGLGTAIAKKIVEDHNGKISFTTATGKGTTFHIRVPATVPQ
jgi:signal transduction histidine kinase